MTPAPQASQDPPSTRSTGRGLIGAVAAAVLLACLAVLPVAWALTLEPSASAQRNAGWVQGPIDWTPMSPLAAVALAIAVVIPAAVVGGLAGGLVWRWRRFAGAAVALVVAWAVAVLTVPIAAAALGIHLRAGIICFFGCQALLRDDQPLGGAIAYAYFLVATVAFSWSWVVPALLLLVVGRVLFDWARGRAAARPRLPLVVLIVGFAIIYGIGLIAARDPALTSLVPYALLAIGVAVWAAWMDRVDPGRSRADEPGAPPASPPAGPSDPPNGARPTEPWHRSARSPTGSTR